MGSKVKFKGDRVRFTDKCLGYWWFGPHTKNKEGVIAGPDVFLGYKWNVKVGDRDGYVDDKHIEPATPSAPTDTTGYTVPLCAYEGTLYVGDGSSWMRAAGKQPAIVCLIENGQPLPSSRPHVHRNKTVAGKEAERLAKKYPGKRFGVYEYVSHAEAAKPAYQHEWQRLAADGQKIAAIKELRGVVGLDLVTAKRAVEAFVDKAA